jgi:hypothetical protein
VRSCLKWGRCWKVSFLIGVGDLKGVWTFLLFHFNYVTEVDQLTGGCGRSEALDPLDPKLEPRGKKKINKSVITDFCILFYCSVFLVLPHSLRGDLSSGRVQWSHLSFLEILPLGGLFLCKLLRAPILFHLDLNSRRHELCTPERVPNYLVRILPRRNLDNPLQLLWKPEFCFSRIRL